MPGFWLKLKQRLRYRITHSSRLPKGDLVSFLMNVSDRGFVPRTIVDVGANRGRWSEKARSVFPDAEYLLVEPQMEMKPQLDEFCKNTAHARWINAGVGDQCGELPFTVAPDTVSSTFTSTAAQAAAQGFESRMVPILTLDEIVKSHLNRIPEMVKIDAEGYEARIMRGASQLIGETEVFLLEVPLIDPPNPEWSGFLELVQLMSDCGYDVYDFTSFQRRPYDGAVGLCEIAFVRRGGVLRQFAGWDAAPARAA